MVIMFWYAGRTSAHLPGRVSCIHSPFPRVVSPIMVPVVRYAATIQEDMRTSLNHCSASDLIEGEHLADVRVTEPPSYIVQRTEVPEGSSRPPRSSTSLSIGHNSGPEADQDRETA